MMENIRIAIPEIGQDMRNYTAAVRGSGMEPVIVSMMHEQATDSQQKEYIDISDFRPENYCGLLLPGGMDINPKRYGQENNGSIGVSDALDDVQFIALDKALKAGIPILGICRGMQVVNVYFGGTMIQDLDTAKEHAWNKKTGDSIHESHANHGSWLSHIYGTTFVHNSAHHQGLGKIGDGLIIDSRSSSDGVVEAVHHQSYPVIGIQWHPERMSFSNRRYDTVDGRLIFDYFMRICRHNRKERREDTGAML